MCGSVRVCPLWNNVSYRHHVLTLQKWTNDHKADKPCQMFGVRILNFHCYLNRDQQIEEKEDHIWNVASHLEHSLKPCANQRCQSNVFPYHCTLINTELLHWNSGVFCCKRGQYICTLYWVRPFSRNGVQVVYFSHITFANLCIMFTNPSIVIILHSSCMLVESPKPMRW